MTHAAIPEGYHSLTPYLTVADAAAAIAFYERAFGAEQKVRMEGPDGAVVHAEIEIGNSRLMLAEASPQFGTAAPPAGAPKSFGVMLYLPDVDAVFARAIAVGAVEKMKPDDQFWGDRMAAVIDPFGHHWNLASKVEDVSEAETARRFEKLMRGEAWR